MKYRIIKKHWRDDDAEIKDYYIIQYLSKYFGWKDYKITVYSFGDCYKARKEFKKEEIVKKYLKNLIKPIPKDKIIK